MVRELMIAEGNKQKGRAELTLPLVYILPKY
jgi:hypothetical protein